MTQSDHLYFIALLPHEELRLRVLHLKEEMRDRFGAKHALKSPAHITLQMPFRRPASEEEGLIDVLARFAHGQMAFNIDLSGFGCFTPRVIFIKVEDHAPVVSLSQKLNEVLITRLGFASSEVNSNIHPHMTIATRDLRKSAFYAAWPEFERRQFDDTFQVSSLCLLRHNGQQWDVFRECKF